MSEHDSPKVLPDVNTQMAIRRTRNSEERTLMAWIRTSLSMISFGFTIYKFLESFARSEGGHPNINMERVKNVGLTLIGLGVIALVAALWQHVAAINELRQEGGKFPFSVAFGVAILMAIFGLLLFLDVLVRFGPL